MSGLVWVQVNESGGLRCWSSFRRACVALYYILHVAKTAPAAVVRREILPIPKSVALHCIALFPLLSWKELRTSLVCRYVHACGRTGESASEVSGMLCVLVFGSDMYMYVPISQSTVGVDGASRLIHGFFM